MTISLTPELDEFVAKQVKSGRYKSNSEVVRAGLRALANADLTIWLQEGLDSVQAGNKSETGAVMMRLRARLKDETSR